MKSGCTQYLFLLNHSLFYSNINGLKPPRVDVVESEVVIILPCVPTLSYKATSKIQFLELFVDLLDTFCVVILCYLCHGFGAKLTQPCWQLIMES